MNAAGEITRNIDTVTAEIVMIREQTKKVFFRAVVDIGSRLIEAKELVPQGEWLHYLDSVLGYKPSTAQNYMRIARELGSDQVALDGQSASDLFGLLGYSQLLPLLGLPEEDRREIAEQNDLPSMSSREIDQLVSDYKAAKAAADEAEIVAQKAEERAEKASKALARAEETAAHEAECRRRAEEHAKAMEGRVKEAMQAAQETAPAEAPSPELVEQIRADVLQEQAEMIAAAEARAQAAEARLEKANNPAALRVNLLFEALQADMARMEEALDELGAEQPDVCARFRGAIRQFFGEWIV